MAEIAEQDEVFCELAWNCIPEGARVNKIRQATGGNWGRKSYKKLSKEQKSIARQAMCYTLFQISFMVYWGGKKYSYKGEEPFDELAVYSLEKYSRRLHIASPLEFCYPDKGSEKTTESHVPYAHYAFGYSKKAAIALMKPEAFGSLEERLADSMEYDLRIFRHFLEKVNSRINLSGHQKRKLINLGILKMLKELLTELMTDDQFKFRVMELLNGEMTLDEWKSNDRFINFFNFLSPRFVTSIQCEIFFNNLSKTFCISKKIREDFDCLKDEEWATFDDGWHLDRVDFGSVVEMLSTLKPGQEDGISYIIRHIAKILSRVASKRPKIADYLDQFFEAVIPRICPNAELSFSSHQAQWH